MNDFVNLKIWNNDRDTEIKEIKEIDIQEMQNDKESVISDSYFGLLVWLNQIWLN